MAAQALPATGDFAGLVDIGNHRKIYLECSGRGAPTVVLISGKGNRADTWSTASPDVRGPTVFSAIAKFTRVCAYDRPGTLFYLDPPYFGCENDYGADMFGKGEFAEMAERLRSLKGRFLLSLNDRPKVREIFAGFALEEVETTYQIAGSGKLPKAAELIISSA